MTYATDINFRRDVIWKAQTSLAVKKPLEYHKKQEKKFGPIYAEVFGLVYEMIGSNKDCAAVFEDKIDKIISARHGFKNIETIRAEEIQELRSWLNRPE